MIINILFSYLAGLITIVAPCVLPVLPVILGASVNSNKSRRIIIITLSTGISIFVASILLRSTTLFINIDQSVWNFISGLIIILVGLSYLNEDFWSKISSRLRLEKIIGSLQQNKSTGVWKDILLGLSIGPIFLSCSPTYSIILSLMINTSLLNGIIYLLAYTLGIITILLLTGLFGHALVKQLRWVSNPKGNFRKFIAIAFVIIGIFIILGIDKQIERALIESQILDITQLERRIMPSFQ